MDSLYIIEMRIIKKFRICGGYYDRKSNREHWKSDGWKGKLY